MKSTKGKGIANWKCPHCGQAPKRSIDAAIAHMRRCAKKADKIKEDRQPTGHGSEEPKAFL